MLRWSLFGKASDSFVTEDAPIFGIIFCVVFSTVAGFVPGPKAIEFEAI